MGKVGYPWYGASREGDRPEQGDFLNSVPIIVSKEVLPVPETEVTSQIIVYDMVVISQSCDLARTGKINRVQVAPVETLNNFLKVRQDKFNTPDYLEALRRNHMPRFYLMNINRSNKFNKLGYLVVDFGHIHTISIKALEALCETQPNRLKLLSPYREQLAQHFARFYMRVGLPKDIPEFVHPRKLR